MKAILILLALFAYLPIFAQEDSTFREEKIFTVVPRYPKPYGEIKALKGFFLKNMVYPKKAISKRIEGKTAIQIVVSGIGELQEVEILNKLDDSINQEMLRMFELMPKWRPTAVRGFLGSVLCTIHFNFEIHKRFLFSNKGQIFIDAIEIIPLDKPPTSIEEPRATLEEKLDTLLKHREAFRGIIPMKEFLSERTAYPETAILKGIEGKTTVQFIICPTEIQQVEILHKLDESINRELLRMVELMPKKGLLAARGPHWYVRCTIHFNFEIQKNKNEGSISIDFIEISPLSTYP